jgi:hypothetical protein
VIDKPRYYILKDREVVPSNLDEWAQWLENEAGHRHIGSTHIEPLLSALDRFILMAYCWLMRRKPRDIWVSTVFLGLDHRYGDGPPLVFETMIFDGPHDGYQTRASTYDEAMAQHEEAVKLARSAPYLSFTDS